VHGIQFLEPDRRGLATAYYGPGSGVGIVMRGFAATAGDRADLRVGVVGLGAGTLAAYAGAGTTLRFYEINPAVVAIAEADFSFLRDARARGARVEVVTGDARLRLDDEASRGRASPYDLLVLDAFSSDAVPAHLLTIEALDVYLRRLRPDGVLAFHLSNLYLDLSPVVRGLARARGLASVKIDSPGDESLGTTPSEWMLLAQRAETLDTSEFREARLAPARAGERTLLWTDDYSSLWPLLR
jgi:spermidine synthase